MSAQQLFKSFGESSVICSRVAHTLFHEGLHRKLRDQGVSQDDCTHIAIGVTAAKAACDSAEDLDACIKHLDGEVENEHQDDCPPQEEGETDEEYKRRLQELKLGFCLSHQRGQGNLGSMVSEAFECFCPVQDPATGQPGDDPWTSPCPGVLFDPATGGGLRSIVVKIRPKLTT